MKKLKNKIALVTGSNGGIGKEIVKRFLKNGAEVICCVRKIDKDFDKFILAYKKKFKNKIMVIEFNLSNEKEIIASIKKIFKEKKKLDVLVNNAGAPHGSLLEMTSIENLKDIFQINFFSQIKIIQLCSRFLKKSKNSSIINIGSLSGLTAIRGSLAYGSSKAAFMFASKIISKEFHPYGIRVNSIAPSVTKTKMLKKMSKASLNEILKISKLKKPLLSSDVANKVLYLASDESSNINGKIVKI